MASSVNASVVPAVDESIVSKNSFKTDSPKSESHEQAKELSESAKPLEFSLEVESHKSQTAEAEVSKKEAAEEAAEEAADEAEVSMKEAAEEAADEATDEAAVKSAEEATDEAADEAAEEAAEEAAVKDEVAEEAAVKNEVAEEAADKTADKTAVEAAEADDASIADDQQQATSKGGETPSLLELEAALVAKDDLVDDASNTLVHLYLFILFFFFFCLPRDG